jgi:hypothetical protein
MKNNDNKFKKVYRFALYGLSGSGKTSLLAALAMPRYPHPLGYTCIWRVIEELPPLSQQEQHLITLHNSKEWLEKAIEQLSSHNVPTPNPAGNEDLIFEYEFTASTHQTFRVELLDYSGELLNPNLSNSTQAKRLRQKLNKMDGILVLVEAPAIKNQNNHIEQTYSDLYPLRQAFSLLRGDNQDSAALDVPLALLLTKWDRYSDIDYANPASEQSKLENFLNSNPPPPHKGLCDVLHFSVTKGNFKVFPVSALGPCEYVSLENNKLIERPKQINPLNSFGLEDAFIWVAQRRDAIDLQNYYEQATISLKGYKQRSLELLKRFPKGSEQAKQIHTLLQVSQKAKRKRIIYTVIGIVALWFIAETTIDLINYRQNIVAANHPHTTHEEIDRAEKWLTEYLATPYFRHMISKIFLSRKKVQTLLTDLQKRRDEFMWGPVAKAMKMKDLAAAYVPVSEYLKYYPYGQHAQEAQDIKRRWQQLENQKAFRRIQALVQASMPNMEKLRKLLNELSSFPKYPAETDEMRQQRIDLENQISEQLVKLTKKQEWIGFLDNFKKNLEAKNFQAAANLLINSHQPEGKLKALKNTFKTVIIQTLEQDVTQALKEQRIEFAVNLLQKYAKLPSELKVENNDLIISKLQRKIAEKQDKVLYEAVRKNQNLASILNYLQKAPLKTMAKYVSNYKTYLDQIAPNATIHDLQLKLAQIHWENVNDDDNIVKVYLNGQQVISKKVDARPNTSTANVGTSLFFTAKANVLITIEIKIINEDIFFDDDYGQGRVEKQLSELVDGYNLVLHDKSGTKTATVTLKINGYPKAPDLPVWQNVFGILP